MEPTPIFVFSLPRSGSTLLQRMLAQHDQIATTSEPWILLPLLYTLRRPGAYTEYGHRTMVRAIEDFSATLSGGRDDYLEQVRQFAVTLYAGASRGETYFLDKSPRYHLIVNEIIELFPSSRFIFLWRQPLAAAASIIDSFGHGSWNLERYSVDLHEGLESLVHASQTGDPRCISVRFEDLVTDTTEQITRLLAFLDLEQSPETLQSAGLLHLGGRMGDRIGVDAYQTISDEPLTKWRRTMGTWYRRRWCRTYLEHIGPHRLEQMGYRYDDLATEVASLPSSPARLASDIVRRTYGRGYRRMTSRLLYPGSLELARDTRTPRAPTATP